MSSRTRTGAAPMLTSPMRHRAMQGWLGWKESAMPKPLRPCQRVEKTSRCVESLCQNAGGGRAKHCLQDRSPRARTARCRAWKPAVAGAEIGLAPALYKENLWSSGEALRADCFREDLRLWRAKARPWATLGGHGGRPQRSECHQTRLGMVVGDGAVRHPGAKALAMSAAPPCYVEAPGLRQALRQHRRR